MKYWPASFGESQESYNELYGAIAVRIQLPADTPLLDRLRAFAEYLDRRLDRLEVLLDQASAQQAHETRARLKTERAELTVIRSQFLALFEREV